MSEYEVLEGNPADTNLFGPQQHKLVFGQAMEVAVPRKNLTISLNLLVPANDRFLA
jgi:hypothetical protein